MKGALAAVSRALLLASLAVSVARGQEPVVIEQVAAVVNEDAIWLSEVRQRSRLFLSRIQDLPPLQRQQALRELYDQVLQRMIDDELIRQAGEELDITVTARDVNAAIVRVREGSGGLTEAQFWQAVAAQGFTREQYREDLRRQIYRLRVLNQRVRQRVNITEEQVRERYDMQVAQARRRVRFRSAQIFVRIPSGAGAAQVAELRQELEAVREGLTSEDAFEDAMARIGGGELGWLQQGEIQETLEEALLALAPGEVSPVVRGPSGFHVFLLREREAGSVAIPPYEEVRMQIFQGMMQQAMQEQETQFLAELRRGASVVVLLGEE